MAPTKARRGKTAAKKGKPAGRGPGRPPKKEAAERAASTNGGEALTAAEKRLEGVSPANRKKAVKMTKQDTPHQEIADFLGLSSTKAKFLVMQQMVEDGDVPAIKADEKSIIKALNTDNGYNSV